MTAPYEYIIEVTGVAESVDLFKRDIMDEDWYVDLSIESSDAKDFTLHVKANRADLADAIDRATTNRNLATKGEVETLQR